MKTRAAAKGRTRLLLAAVCVLASLLVVPAAEASRSLPAALAPVLEQGAPPARVLAERPAEPQSRFRLFGDLSLPERPLELVQIQKTASGVSTCEMRLNIWQTGGLSQNCSGPSFQGLWTDPVTGTAYARNRWYDARTASWLSEDPLEDVDSPNLYAFVGWGPHAGRDPMGQNIVDPDLVLNPQYRHFEFEGGIYGVSPTTLAVGLQTPGGYRTLNPNDAADAETIAVIHSMYMGRVSLPANYQMAKVLQGVNRQLTDEERRQTESDLIGVTPIAGDIQDFYIVWSGVNPITGEELGPWEYGLTVVAAALPVVSGHTVARIVGKAAGEGLETGTRLGRRSLSREGAQLGDVIEAADVPLEVTARHPLLRSAPKHHVFPQARRNWFKERGIDIDMYTIQLDEGTHSALHYGGGPGAGGGW